MKKGSTEAVMQARFWQAMREALYEDMMTVAEEPKQAPKLKVAQVRDIQARFVMGEKEEALAAEYGVCASAISYHVSGLPRLPRAAA